MLSWFAKLTQGLSKTTRKLARVLGHWVGVRVLSPEDLEALEQALYEADFGVATTEAIMVAIQKAYRQDPQLQGQAAMALGAQVLEGLLQGAGAHIEWSATQAPLVIALLGVNGAGKTTTAAKLAYHYKAKGHTVLMGACDTFRPAANEQILSWAQRYEIPHVSSQMGADPSAVAYDTLQAAKSRGTHLVLLDTAGRLHNKTHLMEELKKMRRVLQKQDPAAPHHTWLVIDGSLGSNSIEQARVFHQASPLTGLVITKLDGTSKGGALVAIYQELKIPIYFVGMGEGVEDLQPFNPRAYSRALFGLEDN
jgi:fused signal recognition particle receptor